jgi:hypothetical protein
MSDRLRDLLSTINQGPDGPVKTSLLGLTRYLDEIDGLLMDVPASYMGAWDGLELLAVKALETPVLQTDLGLAEVRIKQLQEQLTACEAALAERDARVLSLSRLVWGAVHNAGRLLTSGRIPRWSALMSAVGVGKTTARMLCGDHKLDPDEAVGMDDLCGGCLNLGCDGGCVCPQEGRQYCTRPVTCTCVRA